METIFHENQKVLLRERKRHTTHRVASPWGVPTLAWRVPTLAKGVPNLAGGVPPRCGRTHTCENITLPHSVGNAGGKNLKKEEYSCFETQILYPEF